MNNIALPKKIQFQEGQEANRGCIIIEPCFPGYGTTLGNALRRVLLSSLSGAAPIGVKIKGADHEFSSLKHLKEDILQLVMNIKKLRLKVFTDEVEKLQLTVHGQKEIKASDIAANSNVEIVNTDMVLGKVTDMAGGLDMEIYVKKGMGYETIDGRIVENKEIGYISIDSIFTPVLSVGLSVDDVRVGKMSNWEKLTLDIKTDGTITVEEAFKTAVNILISQFNALINPKEEAVIEETVENTITE